MAKSFAHLDHKYLAPDGYPKSQYWEHPDCQASVLKNSRGGLVGDQASMPLHFVSTFSGAYQSSVAPIVAPSMPPSDVPASFHSAGGKRKRPYPLPTPELRVPTTLPSLYDGNAPVTPVPGKVRRGRRTRHPARARRATAERRADISLEAMKARGSQLFNCEFSRHDDPVLPIEDYDRTMEIISKLYKVYTHGEGQFVDRDSKKLICTFAFQDLQKMDEAERQEHQQDVDITMMASDLFRRLPTPQPAASVKKPSVRPTTNGALIHGEMFCLGHRAGFNSKILFSPYVPVPHASLSLYRLFLSELPFFGKRIGTRFETFADEAFLTARDQLETLKAPGFASTSKSEPRTPHEFAGNFAFTFHNFYNMPHVDNDKGKVYCIWYPIDSVSRKIVTHAEGFRLKGGWFVFPEYRLAFNFGTKYAVQMCWSGKSTFHQTLPSKETKITKSDAETIHYTRLGCSSQITSTFARAALKNGTEEQFNFKSNCERKVWDCDDILKDTSRRWKP